MNELNLFDTSNVDVIAIKDIIIEDRIREDMGDMKLLESSIKDKGLIVPITVKKLGDKFKLQAGGRRLQACKNLHKAHVPARIYPEELSALDEKEIELFENIHRESLSPYESAKIKNDIVELQKEKLGEKKIHNDPNDEGASISSIARMLGVSKSGLADDINLYKTMEAFPELKKSKTKLEAKQKISKLQRQFKEDKSIKKFEKDKKEGKVDKEEISLTNWYKIGNVYDKLPKLSEGIISLFEIDPPYGIGLQDIKKGDNKLITEDYNEVSEEEYKKLIKFTVEQAYRTMKRDSWLIIWFAPEPFFEFTYQTCIDAGFKGRRLCGEWVKPQGQTQQPKSYLANSSEWFFYMAKGSPEIIKPGTRNVFTYPTVSPTAKTHPTERPIELIQDILSTFAYPKSLICSPFAGSGNTLLAAVNNDMMAFGWDLSEEYKKSYLAKISEQEYGKFKSLK